MTLYAGTAIVEKDFEVDVDDEKIFGEIRAVRDDIAARVGNQRTTVEHQFVLAAHLVDVCENDTIRTCAVGDEVAPHLWLVAMERRAVDTDHNFGALRSLLCDRTACPEIFANLDSKLKGPMTIAKNHF